MKKFVLAGLCILGLSGTAIAEDVGHGLDVSGNVAVTSDYVWRGVTQTDGDVAIQGGFDLAHKSGLYVGNWNSNVVGGIEMDLYGGVSNQMFGGPISYDVGYIKYLYPSQATGNFEEVYAGLVGDGGDFTASFMWYHNPGNGGDYYDLGLEVPVSIVTLSGHYGNDDANTSDWSVGASVPFASLDWSVVYTDSEADDSRWSFMASKGF